MSIRLAQKVVGLVVLVAVTATYQVMLSTAATSGVDPKLESSGPITFGADGVLFVADNQTAAIYALEMGALETGGTSGTKDMMAIDQIIAALVGTDPREIQITDLAISPTSRNAFLSISRGRGAGAKPVLLRVDGAGTI